MKRSVVVLASLMVFHLHPALAQSAQQNKMTTCNEKATGMKGEERKTFMKDCLSSKPTKSVAQQAQQDRMKTCNTQAAGKTGDERKAFMSSCLKK